MKIRIVLSLVAACGVFSSVHPDAAAAAAAAPAESTQRYRCPMHPSILQDHKGDCPICGMKLLPVKDAALAPAQGAVATSAASRRALGIVVGEVRRAAGTRSLRFLGRVTPDEKRVYRINAGVEGSIREVSPVTTGSRVKKDQILGSFWAPTALSTIQLFILNISGKEYMVQRQTEGAVEGDGSATLAYANIQQRTMQLENLGVSALQREELARTRKVPDTIKIVSPSDGFVLARNATPQMKFNRGEELFRIADLRQVWVVADVFLNEARYVRPGMKATVTQPEQGIALSATVAEILPQFDPTSRTLKVRLEVDNRDLLLRPEMFVNVNLEAALPEAIAVPGDAVIDSGLAKTVFVERGEGSFEPRKVTTGWRDGDLVEITAGLSPGERIAVSGAFFLDSETRMRAPAFGAAAERTVAPDPTGSEDRSRGGAGPRAAPAAIEEAARPRAGQPR
ncbi:MAG TPA: efflux RND transporter periplasmic adaptor subunit [Myxococcales bacterium]